MGRLMAAMLIAAALLGAETKVPHRAKAPAPQATTAQQDQQIEAAIRARLAKSKIGKDGFRVRVQGGVAYWEGSTAVVQHKGAATRMAKAAGARAVVNHIQVSQEARDKASGNLQKGRRRVQVKRGEARSQP
jgi:BON domain